MTLVAKSGTPSLSSLTPPQNDQIAGLVAGEDIAAGDVCYIHSDGTVRRSNGTADNAAAVAVGIAPTKAQSGQAVTLYRNVRFDYGSGLTPGAPLYVAATAGRLDTATTTGGLVPVAFCVTATRIHFVGTY
jgi:hypothetical protein